MTRLTGKKAVRFADGAVNLVVVCLLLIMLVFGGYSLWDSNQVYKGASSSNWSSYKPGPKAEEQLSFDQLQAINSDVIGWIEIYGTDIDYPICQTTDNMRYVSYNAKGEYSLSGCPFLDCQNAPDFSDFNSIIYGHHMDVPAMFGELDRFGDSDYFSSHRYGTIFYGGTLHGLEIFTFFADDAYDSSVYSVGVSGQSNQQAYLDNLQAKSEQSRDIGVSTDDHIVLLSTCASSETNGRFIVAARITDDVQANPFAGTDEDGGSAWSIWDWLKTVPWWAWLLLLLLLILLILVVARKIKGTRDRKNEGRMPIEQAGALPSKEESRLRDR